LRARLKNFGRLGNLGITARLVISLACVAVLAAAANFFVESGVTVVTLVSPAASPAQAAAPALAPRSPASASAAASQRDASRLALSLGAFDQTVRTALEATADSAPTHQLAMSSLTRAAEGYVPGDEAGIADALAMRDTVLAHGRDSRPLLEASHRRRVALDEYSTTLSTMSTRLQKSIDRAWKIMGRVVARQSLMKLSAQLDDIQSLFSARDASRPLDALSVQLAQAEQVFAMTLQKNADALVKSQGADWVDGMRTDVVSLDAARHALTLAEKRRAQLATRYFAESERLQRRLSEVRPRAADLAVTAPQPKERVSAASLTTVPAASFTPASATDRRAAAETTTTTVARRPLVASLSLVVLGLLTWLSIVTILGVVRQVRRLKDATRRLANGEWIDPVRPVGIRELDELGAAVDSMGRQLAAAQQINLEAQRRLEGTVAERTRDLKALAEKDPLTGLPNRRQLFTELDEAIEWAHASKQLVGVFYLDVDNFKTLNDSMGHAFGDRVLIEISRRLEATAQGFGFAGRLGGDEFMIVQVEARTTDEIRAAGDEIVRAFEAPIGIEGREIIVSVSVGASVYPDHEEDSEALLRAADAALFSAKELGRSRVAMFTPELLERATAKFAIEQRLRRAIEKREFELFYQPEINVQTLEVSLVEALIRWRMPDGSYQCPGEFLAVAEEFGLIAEIDEWVLNTALDAAAQWHHGPWPEACVAINVSPRQLLDQRFVGKLRDLLARHRLPARCVELELTESVLQTGPATIKALTELRALGIAIALDDFGTGYSSIASLEQLPLTRVKLDRSLIARIDSSARSASIARATLGLCAELGLEVTAEGVERVEQFSALLGFGAISLQGYLLAEPAPRGEVLAALHRVPGYCQELVLSCSAPTATARLRHIEAHAALAATPA